MKCSRHKLLIALVLTAAGCATTPASTRPHVAPASTTEANDDSLMADGYVNVGSVEVEIEKERCRGTDREPSRCQPGQAAGESRALLRTKAAERGGDLVRVGRYEVPSTGPWVETDCVVKLTGRRPPAGFGRNMPLSQVMGANCVDEDKVVGFRRLLVSTGSVWKRAPELVPNMRLVRAVEAGDEAQVAELLPQITARDNYLDQSPLLIAAKKGNAAILSSLLGAGLKTGRDEALLVTVARGDELGTQALLAAGAGPDTVDPNTHEHPLHIATRREASPVILKLLIDAHANVNALNAANQMPLQCALVSCDVRAARMLIEAGANRAWTGADQETIDTARGICPDSTRDIVELLFK